jgi:hypothetical protein
MRQELAEGTVGRVAVGAALGGMLLDVAAGSPPALRLHARVGDGDERRDAAVRDGERQRQEPEEGGEPRAHDRCRIAATRPAFNPHHLAAPAPHLPGRD